MFRPLSSLILASSLLVPAVSWAAETTPTTSQGPAAARLAEGEFGLGELEVEFDGVPTYSARLEKQSKRLIIDVAGAGFVGSTEPITEAVGAVGGVLTQTFQNGKAKTSRITVTLSKEAQYAIGVADKRLIVRFQPGALGAVVGLDRREAQARTHLGEATPTPETTEIAQLGDVRYQHETARDVVELALDGRVRFRLENASQGRSSLILRNAKIPKSLTRTLDVAAFAGGVHSISSFASGNDVIIEVQRDTKMTSSIERRGNKLFWSFYEPGSLPSTLTGLGKDGHAARRSRTISLEKGEEDLPEVQSGNGRLETSSLEAEEAGAFGPGVVGQQAGYSGQRIDLDLKDADIHNVLRLIGDVSRRNIVVADNVRGRVTIRLRNVPWDQALAVILQSKNLGMVEQGNMLRVAPLDELQKERELEMQRRATAVKLAPIETRLVPVSYAQAGDLAKRVQVLLSPRGTIAVDERTNTLIAR
ncbi:MAG TPA: AMIN domain-containing protein, partial [Polyangiaceae bacterium]|nr:AMIN domain-containing protein [Polyangiaceae bacterium]